MAYNHSIDPSTPPNTGEAPSLGASRIRSLKEALIERLTSFIYGMDSAGTETEIGFKSTPLRVQATAPSTPTNGVEVYAKDVSGKAEMFVRDEDGDEVKLTNAGGINETVFTAYEDDAILSDLPLAVDIMYMYYRPFSLITPSTDASVRILFRILDDGDVQVASFRKEQTMPASINTAIYFQTTFPVKAGYTVTATIDDSNNVQTTPDVESSVYMTITK